jgi:hypothetical protein
VTTKVPDSWKLSQLEFSVAWQALGRDRMPFPLELRTDAPTRSDFEREARAAAMVVADRARADDMFYRALHAVAQPRVRVEIFGYRRDGRDRMVRVHGGIDDGAATVIAQEPGPDLDSVGDLLIFAHSPGGFLKRIVAVLPSVPAGTVPGVSIHRADLTGPEHTRNTSHHRSPRERALRFFGRPYRTYVEIKVDIGPALDGWQEGGHYLHVVDFVEEGRYLLSLDERVEATPLTADELHTRLARLIEQAQAREQATTWR